ncbi:MAG: hypothetical protein PHV11_08065 [Candidatus Bipolaricaulis sp.]|nr:hypothetical protein [Candidatus Bipolaricaulis sp.]
MNITLTSKQLYDKKKDSFNELWARYDQDRDLVYMTDYKIKDSKGKPINNTVSVTMNKAALDAKVVADRLMQAKKQLVIEGTKNNRPMRPKETSKIEAFLESAKMQADDLNKRRNVPGLRKFAANQLTVRGAAFRRVWTYLDDSYVPDILTADIRYVVYEYGTDGLWWFGYTVSRPAYLVNEQYKTSISEDKECELLCCYDDTKEDIWLESELISTKKHKFGYAPGVVELCAEGFQLRDKDFLVHDHESALWLNRKLYDSQNMQASIEATLDLKTVIPPYVKPRKDMAGPDAAYPDKPGTITEYPEGEIPTILEQKDLNSASRNFSQRIEAALGAGGADATDLGAHPIPDSAVLLQGLSEIRSRKDTARLEALAGLDEQTDRMLIDQYKAGGFQSEVGIVGHKVNITPADLEGDYTIRYIYTAKDPKMEIVNMATAQAAASMGIPKEVWVPDILKYDKPDELLEAMDAAQAERDDPTIGMFRRAHALVDEAEDLDGWEKESKLYEAQQLTLNACQILKNRTQPQPQEQPEGNSNALMALPKMMGGGTQRAPQEANNGL